MKSRLSSRFADRCSRPIRLPLGIPALPLLCYALAAPSIASAQGPITPPPPPVLLPVFECIEAAQNLGGTPLATLAQPAPWGIFSYYSSYPSALTIPRSPPMNYFTPGPIIYSGQPTIFFPGYHKDAVSVQLGNSDDLGGSSGITSYFTSQSLSWVLSAGEATTWDTASLPPGPPTGVPTPSALFCPATMVPAIPILSFGGTYPHQLLATLLNPPPAQLPVTLASRYSLTCPATDCAPTDNNGVGLTNLQYQNGNIYADVRLPVGSGTFVDWPELIASVNGTVVAFGHMPILEAMQCSASLQPPSLSGALLGSSYTQSFTATQAGETFTYSTTGALPPGLAFASGTLSGTPTAGGTYPFTVIATPSDSSCAATANYSLTVAGPTCANDVTSQVAVTLSGLKRNLATGQWTETVTLYNPGLATISGPINLVIESLSSNAALVNSQGATNCFAPAGSPYVSAGSSIGAGQTASVTLTFTNSQPVQSITFTPRVAAGGNQI